MDSASNSGAGTRTVDCETVKMVGAAFEEEHAEVRTVWMGTSATGGDCSTAIGGCAIGSNRNGCCSGGIAGCGVGGAGTAAGYDETEETDEAMVGLNTGRELLEADTLSTGFAGEIGMAGFDASDLAVMTTQR